jgi:DNA-binding CsgD family transcriptional regulator
MMGDEEGWAAVAELPQEAADPREGLSLAVDWMNAGEMAMYWGRYAQARQALAIALGLAAQHQYPRVHDNVQVVLAYLDWFTGAWSGLAEGAAALAGDEEPQIRVGALLVGGLLDVAAGRCQSGEEKLQIVISEARQHGWLRDQAAPSAALAWLRLATGQAGDALALTEEPMRVVLAKGIWIWATDVVLVRVQALAASGDNAQAAKLVTAFARGLGSRDAPAPQAALVTCRAVLAQARGQHHRAAALSGQAAEAWDRLPRPYDALLARERQGRCLLAADRREAGLGVLAGVLRGLSALGATADAERVEHLLRESGVKSWRGWRGGRQGYGDRLSPRETEVVQLAAAGHTNREIAHELFRSPKTVEIQLSSAMRKLGVSSRTALVLHAIQTGTAPQGEHLLNASDHPLPGTAAAEVYPVTTTPPSLAAESSSADTAPADLSDDTDDDEFEPL